MCCEVLGPIRMHPERFNHVNLIVSVPFQFNLNLIDGEFEIGSDRCCYLVQVQVDLFSM